MDKNGTLTYVGTYIKIDFQNKFLYKNIFFAGSACVQTGRSLFFSNFNTIEATRGQVIQNRGSYLNPRPSAPEGVVMTTAPRSMYLYIHMYLQMYLCWPVRKPLLSIQNKINLLSELKY
jgi:hypothetical protein